MYNKSDSDYSLVCPCCYSDNIIEIDPSETDTALGLYQLYYFIGEIDKLTKSYRCNHCFYEW